MSASLFHICIVFLGAYGLSSIPFGIVITRLMGLGDLRTIGSGNIGATNVLRTGSKLAAALTLIGDIGKGGLAVLITASLTQNPALIAIAAIAGVIGHCFPVWLSFNGGKGVATGIGVILAVNPWAGVAMMVTWLVTAGVFRISSLAAIVSYLAAPIWVFTLTDLTEQWPYTLAAGMIAGISIWRHQSNIARLIKGQEPRIGK